MFLNKSNTQHGECLQVIDAKKNEQGFTDNTTAGAADELEEEELDTD